MVSRAVLAFLIAATLRAQAPLIQNERVTVWDQLRFPAATAAVDTVVIDHAAKKATFYEKSSAIPGASARQIRIDLKDVPGVTERNTTAFSNAFPRPGSKKLIENPRVIVWEYEWAPNIATPMHFHDKDVVVVYFEDGTLRSTTDKGDATDNAYTSTTVRFNPRKRIHTETLVKGKQHAIMTELK